MKSTVFALLFVLLSFDALFAQERPFFEMSAAKARAGGGSGQVWEVSPRLDQLAEIPERLEIALAEGSVVAHRHRVQLLGDGDFYWSGRGEEGERLSILRRQGRASAVLETARALYWLRPSDGGYTVLEVANDELLGRCATEELRGTEPGPLEGLEGDCGTGEDLEPPTERVRLDVLVVYTQQAVCLANGLADCTQPGTVDAVEQAVEMMVLRSNEILADSGIDAEFRLVHQELAPQACWDSGDIEVDLDCVAGNQEIANLRNEHSADLVGLIIADAPDYLGMARGMRRWHFWKGQAPRAFQVTELNAGLMSETFTHEFGHNLGLHHQQEHFNGDVEDSAFCFSFGHDDDTGDFRTLMGVRSGQGRIGRLSDPTVDYNGVPLGRADRDNARALSLTAQFGAKFRSENDHFAKSWTITGETGTAEGHNHFATEEEEDGEPAHGGGPYNRSIWWNWTAPSSGSFRWMLIGSGTGVGIFTYSGSTLAGLTPVASTESRTRTALLEMDAVAGTVYHIAVATHPLIEGGDMSLSWFADGEFSDVEEGAWYEPYLIYASSHGVIQGLQDGSFAPERSASRAETLKIAYEGAAVDPGDPGTTPIFPDVDPNDPTHWFAPYVHHAAGAGYVVGRTCEDGSFGFCPHEPVSRYEAAKILHAVFEEVDYSALSGACDGSFTSPFPDVRNGDWYCLAVEWLSSAEVQWNGEFAFPLVSGYSVEGWGQFFGGDQVDGQGRLLAVREINRAEMARILANAMNFAGTGGRVLPLEPGSLPQRGSRRSTVGWVSLGSEFAQRLDPTNATAPAAIELPGGVQQVVSGPVSFAGATHDGDGDPLVYFWSATGGSFTATDPVAFSAVTWHPPVVEVDTTFVIHAVRGDRRGKVGRGRFELTVRGGGSNTPSAGALQSPSGTQSGSVTVSAYATDPDGLQRVHAAFVSGGPELELCGPAVGACGGTAGTFSVAGVDPASFGASPGLVTVDLFVEDASGATMLVDSQTFTYEPTLPGPGHRLTLLKQGPGDGTLTADSLSCPPGCPSASLVLPEGTSVTVRGVPDATSLWVGFAGDRCYGVADCTLTMTQDLTVRASFGLPDQLAVTISNPADGDTSVQPNVQPLIYFNRPVNLGPAAGDIVFREQGGPDVVFTPVVSTQGSNPRRYLALVPQARLAHDTAYEVVIPAGAVVDDDGALLAAPFAFSYATAPDEPIGMFVTAYPIQIREGAETRVSVWFTEPTDHDRTITLSSTEPGVLKNFDLGDFVLPAGEVLLERQVDTELTPGSTAAAFTTLQASEPGGTTVSRALEVANYTNLQGSNLRFLAASVINDDDGDGVFEAGEGAELFVEVRNYGSSPVINAELEFQVLNAFSLRILGGRPYTCFLGTLQPNQYASCTIDLQADEDLPTGNYYIEIDGGTSSGGFLDQARVRVVNGFLPDFTITVGPLTSNALQPGTVVDLDFTARNRGDGFTLTLPEFEVVMEVDGVEEVLYRIPANARGDYFSSQSFELPIVAPSVPGSHRIWARINPGPNALAESDTANNDSAVRVLNVAEPPQPPVLEPLGGPFAVAEGQLLHFTARASDPNGDPLTFSLGAGAPAGAAIHPTTGGFEWTPPCGAGGSYPIEVRVSDGDLTDSATVQIEVGKEADLTLSLDSSLSLALPGQMIQLTVVVRNDGPSCASGRVTSAFPATLTEVSWLCTASGGSCTAAQVGEIDDPISLDAGGSATYTVTATLSDSATGSVTATAAVAPDPGTHDPLTGNNGAGATITLRDLDYGDAPDAAFGAPWAFPTLLSADGARHGVDPGLVLGTVIDGEADGLPTLGAEGDDLQGAADEDGVVFAGDLVPCGDVGVEIEASAGGLLDAWIDFDTDGDWDDPGEQIFASEPLTAGLNSRTVSVPCATTPNALAFARFRFGSTGGLQPRGLALDGEVEDYALPTAAVLFPLAVSRAGSGSGTVTSSPEGILCGADCDEDYPLGAVVTLTATPAANSAFSGWSGAGCSGAGLCALTMDMARAVTATFEPGQYDLTVEIAGSGDCTVTSDPPGIDCGVDCAETYLAGTGVTLIATPAMGTVFSGWTGGGCSGAGPCALTMNASQTVTATCDLEELTVTVSRSGEGSGLIRSDLPGIDCGTECSADYAYGTEVTLTAEAGVGSSFAGWSGDCAGTGLCELMIDQGRAVDAAFSLSCVDTVENGAGNWLFALGPGSPWEIVATQSRSPVSSLFVEDSGAPTDQILTGAFTVPVVLPNPRLRFWQQVDTVVSGGGGVLEYSADGGLSWHDILDGDGATIPANPTRFVSQGYGGTLSSCCGNPLGGREAWTGSSGGWQRVEVDLTDFAGHSLQVRWRFGADSSPPALGWWIDDIAWLNDGGCVLPVLFRDGFEGGGVGRWSQAVP